MVVKIKDEVCTGCGGCIDLCPVIAIGMINDKAVVNDETCTECNPR